MAEQSIHLQGIGRVKAIPASDLRVGMSILWNYGGADEVVKIAPKGAQSLTVTLRYQDGITGQPKEADRVMRATRLVAGFWPKAR